MIGQIDWKEGHKTVVGSTGSGKSYSVRSMLNQLKHGVLYFNTTHENVQFNWVQADWTVPFSAILKAIRAGKKVNYLPSIKREIRDKELGLLIDKLFEANKDVQDREDLIFTFAIEEVHLYKKDAKNKLIEMFTTGRKFNFRAVAISPRPAMIDNDIITMSREMLIFWVTQFENEYFKTYKLPYDMIMASIKKRGKHGFMAYDWQELKGAFVV